jgi:DNA-binding NarL/FixJ family response regulator
MPRNRSRRAVYAAKVGRRIAQMSDFLPLLGHRSSLRTSENPYLPRDSVNRGSVSVGEGGTLPQSREAARGEGRATMGENPRMGVPIRVLLADDHTMFREGLAGVLASYGGLEVVAEVPNDSEAIRLAQELRPDVVVMQVQMPFERARESLRRMRSLVPSPKVIVVTMFENPRYVRELMGLGASAFLVKSSSAEHLMAAVRAAAFDPHSRNVVVGMPLGMLEGAQEGVDGVLTARELEVLLLASRGLSDRQIAARLHVAEATAKRHMANVRRNLGVASRGEASRKALWEGWITIEEITHEEDEAGGEVG